MTQKSYTSDVSILRKTPQQVLEMLAFGAIVCFSILPSTLWANNDGDSSTRNKGHVVLIESDRAFVDLGREDGITEGAELVLYRVVNAVHPTTQEKIQDRFRLGAFPVVETGEVLAVIQLPNNILSRVSVGDEVLHQAAAVSMRVQAMGDSTHETIECIHPSRQDSDQLPDIEHSAFLDAFGEASSLDLPERLAIWQSYLESHPQSPYAELIQREAQAIEAITKPEIEEALFARFHVLAPLALIEGESLRVVAS